MGSSCGKQRIKEETTTNRRAGEVVLSSLASSESKVSQTKRGLAWSKTVKSQKRLEESSVNSIPQLEILPSNPPPKDISAQELTKEEKEAIYAYVRAQNDEILDDKGVEEKLQAWKLSFQTKMEENLPELVETNYEQRNRSGGLKRERTGRGGISHRSSTSALPNIQHIEKGVQSPRIGENYWGETPRVAGIMRQGEGSSRRISKENEGQLILRRPKERIRTERTMQNPKTPKSPGTVLKVELKYQKERVKAKCRRVPRGQVVQSIKEDERLRAEHKEAVNKMNEDGVKHCEEMNEKCMIFQKWNSINSNYSSDRVYNRLHSGFQANINMEGNNSPKSHALQPHIYKEEAVPMNLPEGAEYGSDKVEEDFRMKNGRIYKDSALSHRVENAKRIVNKRKCRASRRYIWTGVRGIFPPAELNQYYICYANTYYNK